MCAFYLLDAFSVTVITSMVLAAEGTLEHLRGTPLPGWPTWPAGPAPPSSTSVIACGVIIATGVVFFDVSIVWHAFGYFVGATLLGVACSS